MKETLLNIPIGAEHYYPLLLPLMAKRYPIWSPVSALRDSLPHVDEILIEELLKSGMVDKSSSYNIPEGTKERIYFYRINSKGFEYVNNLSSHKTNNLLLMLAIITSISGFIQISLMIWQIILQSPPLG